MSEKNVKNEGKSDVFFLHKMLQIPYIMYT